MKGGEVVERIRSLLARFSENEEAVRWLVATDARFDALCEEYREVTERLERVEAESKQLRERRVPREDELPTRLEGFQAESRRLRERRARLEEELLTRIEGHQPK